MYSVHQYFSAVVAWNIRAPIGIQGSDILGFYWTAMASRNIKKVHPNCPVLIHWNIDFMFNECTLWSLWSWQSYE